MEERAIDNPDVAGKPASFCGKNYGPVVKVEVEFDSPLDLLTAAVCEGGMWWEPTPDVDPDVDDDEMWPE